MQQQQYHVISRPLDPPGTLLGWWRQARCEEADCPRYLNGFVTMIDERTNFGQAQARYIRKHSGREFTEAVMPDGLTHFTFKPGQQCWSQHKIPTDKDPLFSHRVPSTGESRVMRPADWKDHFNEGSYRLQRGIDRG